MLHVVLLKMYPVSYKRRENQTLESYANKAQSESSSLFQDNDTTKFNQNCSGNEVTEAVHLKEENLLQNNPDGNHKRILLGDVVCAACNQLLFRPVVINCVYGETCIIIPAEGKLTCQVCQTIHPCGSPKVCLELDKFLEKEVPDEYSHRKVTFQHTQAYLQHESSINCSTEASKIDVPSGESAQWWSDRGSKVHIRVGCDFCGMYPIIGDRYRCKDSVEEIGFDLCGECYNTRSKLPGRFNQQHTLEHQFELVRSNIIRNIILRLVTDPLDNGTVVSVHSDDASVNLENGSPPLPPILLGDTWDNAENDPIIPDASHNTEGDEDDIQSAI